MGLQSLPSLNEAEVKTAHKIATALRLNHTGKAKSISNSQMVTAINKIGEKASGPTIRKMINWLRHKGRPICSDSTGYWWAENKKEIADCINALKERIEAQIATLDQLKEMYKTF